MPRHTVPFFFYFQTVILVNRVQMSSSPFHTLLWKLVVPTDVDTHAAQKLGIQGCVCSSQLSLVWLSSCAAFRFYFIMSVCRSPNFLNCHQLWGLKLCLLLLTAVRLSSAQCLVILIFNIIISCDPMFSWERHLKLFCVGIISWICGFYVKQLFQ